LANKRLKRWLVPAEEEGEDGDEEEKEDEVVVQGKEQQ